MIEEMVELPDTGLSIAGRLDNLAELFESALVDPGTPQTISPLRQAIADVRAETEIRGIEGLHRALCRIGLLAELWECLAAEPGSSAEEIALFCVKALAQLAHCDRSGEGCEDVVHWIILHSSSCWGDYLGLLEPEETHELEDVASHVAPEPPEDELPAIDSRALLRLFGAGAGEDSTAAAEPFEPGKREPGHDHDEARDRPAPASVDGPPRDAPRSAMAPVLKIPELPESLDLDDEIREAFLADASDLFERIEPLVLGLSQPADPSAGFDELARCFHTLKGAAGSVGLTELAAHVHALEEHLESARGSVGEGLVELLLQTLGYLEGLLRLLRTRRSGPSEPPAARPHEAPAVVETVAAAGAPSMPQSANPVEDSTAEGPIRVPASRIEDLMDLVSELISRRRLWSEQAQSLKSMARLVRGCRSRMLGCLDRLHEAGLGRHDGGPSASRRGDLPGQLLRLGELADDLSVLAETAQTGAVPLADHGDALGRLTMQLWDELQAIRVVAIRGLFQRLARVAQEAARIEGRQVEVVMDGDGTGVDRAVQDKAFEPLLHGVRNAVGHGLESPSDRLMAGKPAAGRITLTARREGNTLVISVQDDGRGLDHEAIAAKARRLGLLAPEETPSAERLNRLIFQSGFSTRSQANAISGRGVGMDVVAREVGHLKGTIELWTEPGKGTLLTIQLPARLALETTMIVRVDGQAFALPVAQIEHARPFDRGELEASDPRDAPARPGAFLVFQDRRIPVKRAREILGIASTPEPAWPKLLVVRSASGLIGLVVDAIDGTEELVIKSLGTLLAGHPMISGTSCSATGEVISILNLAGLHHFVADGPATEVALPLLERREAGSTVRPAVLVVDDSISVRRVVARHLRTFGLDVDEVADGLEALARLRARTYGLVVTDLEMPRLDGFELLAEMQRMPALAAVPVIAASTRVDDETRRRALGLGARTFLPKPIDASALAGAVRPFLDPEGG
jgi:chemotaxis protein histidine kinase CheA